jgi:hypothetical protein
MVVFLVFGIFERIVVFRVHSGRGFGVSVVEYLILVTKNVIVDVVLLGSLWSQNKRLHKPSHGFVIVGKLAKDLDDHPRCEGSMGVHLTNFSFTIAKIELLDFLVDFLLAMHRF